MIHSTRLLMTSRTAEPLKAERIFPAVKGDCRWRTAV